MKTDFDHLFMLISPRDRNLRVTYSTIFYTYVYLSKNELLLVSLVKT